MKRSKKGMELAINTLVIIILGVVILGIGFSIVNKLMKDVVDITSDVDEGLKDELRKTQFNDGSLVAVLNPHATINRGKSGFFLLGFVNKEKTTKDFKVVVRYSDSSPIEDELRDNFMDEKVNIIDGNYILYLKDDISLEPNQEFFAKIAFSPSKKLPPGEYYYNVYVCYIGDGQKIVDVCDKLYSLYGSTKKRLYVTVT